MKFTLIFILLIISTLSFSQVENEETITVKKSTEKSETGIVKKITKTNTLKVKRIERPVLVAPKKEKVTKTKVENN